MSESWPWILRLGVSIGFSNREFPSIARPSHTILRRRAKIKKRSLVLRTRKILLTMMDETDIDDGGQPEAAVNEGNELKHSRLLVHPLQRMRDTMALVPSSRVTVYKSCLLSK